jgi:predicted N-acyltransferase
VSASTSKDPAAAERQTVVQLISSIAEVDAADWDACANPDPACYDPFVSHAFLKALEDAGCTEAGSGWAPHHLLVHDDDDRLIAAAPCYLKGHSRGEYMFDDGWADAYERAGGNYYPKLQCAVPFTPVPGRRLLVHPEHDLVHGETILIAALQEIVRRHGLSSFHATFCSEDEWTRLGALGLLQRVNKQFHWTNAGYGTFDDFLATLASRKRKVLRKERREAIANDIEIEWLTGADITEAHWDTFYDFYMDTGSRKWGVPYLNREFFSRLGASMADQCLLIMCRREGRYIAGALNMIGGDCLYGRYWGCSEHHRFLHFEVCYYQAIDFAIAHGLARVEAGAQGEHKLLRGYLPVPTYSVHYIADPSLRKAIAQFVKREQAYVEAESAELASYAPFRKDG